MNESTDWRAKRIAREAAKVTPITPEVGKEIEQADIPAQLRKLADKLEGNQDVTNVILVMALNSEPYPRVAGFGPPLSLAEADGLLLQAAMQRKA